MLRGVPNGIFQTIPDVYDDSMSYYEQVLVWIETLKQMDENLDAALDTIKNLEETIEKSTDAKIKAAVDKLNAELRAALLEEATQLRAYVDTVKNDILIRHQSDFNDLNRRIGDEQTARIRGDNDLRNKIEQVETELTTLINSIDQKLTTQIENLEQEVREEIAAIRAEIRRYLDEQLQEFRDIFNQELDAMKTLVEQQIARINELIADVQKRMAVLQQQINTLTELIYKIPDMLEEMSENLKAELYNYIDRIFEDKKLYYVVNPITGRIDNINPTLDLIWRTATNSLTAGEYAEMKIKAGEYAERKYTALTYLKLLRKRYIEYMIYMATSMQNPFTGTRTSFVEIVEKLIGFHIGDAALTAGQYAEKHITAAEYESKKITAYEYLWAREGKLD